MTDCSFRFSRFDLSWRQADGTYPEGTWTELFELLDRAGSREAALGEYEPVEDAYVAAVVALMGRHGTDQVRLTDVERNSMVTGLLTEAGCAVAVPDPLPDTISAAEVPSIVRAGLRGQLWCQIRGTEIDVTFGFDLYVHVRSGGPCAADKAAVEGLGLFVQDADYPVE